MTKMLRFAIISLLLLTGVASANHSAIYLGVIWNFQNERVSDKVKKIEELGESGLPEGVEYYNKAGQKTRIEGCYEGELVYKYTMEYNKYGDPFRASYFWGVSNSPYLIETAEYEARGVIKYIICKYMDGNEVKTLKSEPFKYDEKKRLKSIKIKTKDGLNAHDFKFDDKGNCTERINNREGRGRTESKFGKYHNGVPESREMQVSSSLGKILASAVLKYKFDKAGNWIEKTSEMTNYYWDSKDKDKKPEIIKGTRKQKRTITYYPEDKKLN